MRSTSSKRTGGGGVLGWRCATTARESVVVVRASVSRKAALEDLTGSAGPSEAFDPVSISNLPEPARRWLRQSIRPGAQLNSTAVIHMVGEIKLKKWLPFRARQVIRIGEGLVWEARVGRLPIVVKGGDTFWRGEGDLDFRLWGLIPVARATGTDIDQSAAGRLAAETVAWAPQGATPQMGATWTGIDATHATVSLPVRDRSIEVTVAVDEVGGLREITMQRWGNPGSKEFAMHPFGASVDAATAVGDVTIASAGRVGWWWGTDRQGEGEFFRYTLV